jgi:hypothetical protein
MKSPITLVDPIVTVIVIPTGGTTPWCTEPLLGRTEDSSDFRMRFSLPYTAVMDTGHPHTISLKLRDLNQLFNSMDPSPFIEKDLDDDAEEFIVSWAQEFSPKAPLKLRIYLDQWPAEDPKELIRTAIHNHFAHSAQIADLEFKRLLRQGRTSLFIGLLFLAGCLLLSEILLGHQERAWAAVVRESLTIAGWVAMWRPMQIYLYDWWPLLRRSRIYRKLSHMPVELVPKKAKAE